MKVLMLLPDHSALYAVGELAEDFVLGVSGLGQQAVFTLCGHQVTATLTSPESRAAADIIVRTRDSADLVFGYLPTVYPLRAGLMPGDAFVSGEFSVGEDRIRTAGDDLIAAARKVDDMWAQRYPELNEILGRGARLGVGPIAVVDQDPPEDVIRQLAQSREPLCAVSGIEDTVRAAREVSQSLLLFCPLGCRCGQPNCGHGNAALLSLSHYASDFLSTL